MKLREIIVKNFRCLEDVTIPVADTTVLVGENNSGKTALLEALRIVLPQRAAGRETPFDEYDYHMVKANDSPQSSGGIVIELWFREDASDEWPDSLVQALTDIIQTDPIMDLDSIGLRLSCQYDTLTKEMVTKWEFLALDGQPLGGKGADPRNLTRFLPYIRCFYLSSLRDSAHEFSPRSQFWGRILRDLKISDEQRKAFGDVLAELNDDLLKADPRLEQVRVILDKGQEIMELGAGQKTSIQALPLKPWDLMSKAEVVIKTRGGEIDFPLARHGQGVQSLAILFLFQAYIDVLLKPAFQPETEAILALEEPEAHLHPQATRALATNLSEIKSQKIISSHSPYFIQEIPLTQVRMFRRDGPSSKVLWVKRSFTAQVPNTPDLLTFCANNAKFDYHNGTHTLSVGGKVEQREYRDLLALYPGQQEVHATLKRLYTESQLYLDDSDLVDLETYVKRIRGEALFARAWLLCEGPSDYLLLRFFAELRRTPLDQAGVAVIDFQNNGSPGAFVGLARAFEIPWVMVCDNDAAGKDFVKQVRKRGLTDGEIKELVRPLPGDGVDLEMFLVKSGFDREYVEILLERNVSLTKKMGDAGFEDELAASIRKDKTGYAIALIEKLRAEGADQSRVPQLLGLAVKDIIAKVVK
ncbi:MAG: AAA family ATPase [Desulfobacterales bacterium]|nr:AAA family ATPase [Desulfobacterales bacterium]